jgi:hypothetical protein
VTAGTMKLHDLNPEHGVVRSLRREILEEGPAKQQSLMLETTCFSKTINFGRCAKGARKMVTRRSRQN